MMRVPLVIVLASIGYIFQLGSAEVTFAPANGYYVCPEGKTCALTKCKDCSIFLNGKETMSDDNGEFSFTATASENDNLSVSGGVGVAKCDDECECQAIGGTDIDSCVNSYGLPIPEQAAGAAGTANDRSVSNLASEESSSTSINVVGLGGFGVVLSASVLLSALV